jgi:hypothetical protein
VDSVDREETRSGRRIRWWWGRGGENCIANQEHQQVDIGKQWVALMTNPSSGITKAFPLSAPWQEEDDDVK